MQRCRFPTGKNELFENIEEGTAHTMAFDKDGNLFLMTNNSTYTILLKIFPDKSFIRLYKWLYKTVYSDGTNDQAFMSLSPQLVMRGNGDIYFITSHAIRKMSFE